MKKERQMNGEKTRTVGSEATLTAVLPRQQRSLRVHTACDRRQF